MSKPSNIDQAKPAAPATTDIEALQQSAPVDQRRRRLTSAGLAASGVILSMASRSTLATGTTSHGSLHSHVSAAKTLGEPPSYWVANAEKGGWQEAAGVRCDTRFGAVFQQCSAADHADASLLDALHARAGDSQAQLAQLVAAAHLNLLSGKSADVFTHADLQQMATGRFTPAVGGAAWDQQKIVAYLKLTMNPTA